MGADLQRIDAVHDRLLLRKLIAFYSVLKGIPELHSRAERREDLARSQTSAGGQRHMVSNDLTLAEYLTQTDK
jgi:hypothetical protein